jgi:3-oxoadipate enol-lactonase
VNSISLRGTNLCYIDQGRGLPLLLVHGFPFDHTMWSGQIDVLSRQYRVIAPDLRGFGLSQKGDKSNFLKQPGDSSAQTCPGSISVTMDQFADDLAAMLDALGVNEPVVFCGLSMGGYIAFQFWRKYAERLRGLILCDTRAVADTPEGAAARQVMADRVLAEGPGLLSESMLPRLLAESTWRERPEVVEALRRTMMGNSPEGIAAAARGMAERPDMTPALKKIHCPTLVVVGEEDANATPIEMRGIAEAITGAKCVEIPAAGHISPLENPAAVNAAILDFLATL